MTALHEPHLNGDVFVATWNSVADADVDETSSCPSRTTDDAGDDDDGMSSGGSLELDHCVARNAPDVTRNVNQQPRQRQQQQQQPASLGSLQTRPGTSTCHYKD